MKSFTIIFGPTASGKSAKALELARANNGNILSFDARQVYVGLDIVTGKDIPPGYTAQAWEVDPSVTVYRAEGQPDLFGFDIVQPDEAFSIRHFYEYVQSIIQWHRENQVPLILVGGSWLYAQVLIDPPPSLFAPQDEQLRTELQEANIEELQQRLQVSAPESWNRLNDSDRNNPRRLIRAIEVAHLPTDTELPHPLIERDEYELILHELLISEVERNIETRIEQRLQQGALEETKKLMTMYPDWNSLPALSATGYKELIAHIQGKTTLDVARRLWFFAERQYAKRQFTWLKKLSR